MYLCLLEMAQVYLDPGAKAALRIVFFIGCLFDLKQLLVQLQVELFISIRISVFTNQVWIGFS